MLCAVTIASALTGVARPVTAQQAPPLPVEETRAVAFLSREVPRWKRENDCYSCHNNGDAARALIVAKQRGHDIGRDRGAARNDA